MKTTRQRLATLIPPRPEHPATAFVRLSSALPREFSVAELFPAGIPPHARVVVVPHGCQPEPQPNAPDVLAAALFASGTTEVRVPEHVWLKAVEIEVSLDAATGDTVFRLTPPPEVPIP